mmetsp:Transcript_24709/g.55867  ORF Transcript_24709/g.55867 Transcript_24709/m.55867 type:complete len:248 (-) Transcript_24709:294-1037(-)
MIDRFNVLLVLIFLSDSTMKSAYCFNIITSLQPGTRELTFQQRAKLALRKKSAFNTNVTEKSGTSLRMVAIGAGSMDQMPCNTAVRGDTVVIKYTVSSEDGENLEGSGGIARFLKQEKVLPDGFISTRFVLGKSQVSAKVENSVSALRCGETARILLEDIFGKRDEDKIYTITKNMIGLPPDMPVALGTTFKINGGECARVVEEDGKWLVLDANHKHAGKRLFLDITLVDIHGRHAGPQEVDFELDR